MPTITRIGSFRVVIYTNDHRPAHVHVMGTGREAVFLLNCPDGPIECRENFGFSQVEANRLTEPLMQCREFLCAAWRRTHGDF